MDDLVLPRWINSPTAVVIRWVLGIAGGMLGLLIVMGAWFFSGFNDLYTPESGVDTAVASVAGAGLLVAWGVPMAMFRPTPLRMRLAGLAVLVLALVGIVH